MTQRCVTVPVESAPVSENTMISEALAAATTTKFLTIGAGTLAESNRIFSQAFPDRSAVVVADNNTLPFAEHVMRSMGSAQLFVFEDRDLYAEHRFVVRLQESLAKHD